MVISWGKMMHQALAFTYLDVWQWWLVPTGLALSATLVAISFLSFSLETAMDPRLRKERRCSKVAMKMLSIRDLKVSFGKTQILRGIDLQPGEGRLPCHCRRIGRW
ncbi:MAG: hypothetical protein MZU95_05150 [Desulfomicrobium escambiense]|nr:hypothetical protein [Desulfomicrobium escambiense]